MFNKLIFYSRIVIVNIMIEKYIIYFVGRIIGGRKYVDLY